MANTSATGGYLYPDSSPLYGDQLNNFFHGVWQGITGLDNALIRPMWQEFDPLMPNKGANCWMFWGIVGIVPEFNAVQIQNFDTYSDFARIELLQLVATFQGRDSMEFAALFRDGLQINQNMDELQKMGMLVQEIGDFEHEPDLYNTLWYSKSSIGFTISRGIRRRYPILTLLDADIESEVKEY